MLRLSMYSTKGPSGQRRKSLRRHPAAVATSREASAGEDQTGQACTSDGAGNAGNGCGEESVMNAILVVAVLPKAWGERAAAVQIKTDDLPAVVDARCHGAVGT
jgi:hypothetical protein